MRTDEMRFIEPDPSLASLPPEDVHKQLGMKIPSGHRANFDRFGALNPKFAEIAAGIKNSQIRCEDQCSDQYYFDLFNCVQESAGNITRVIEVGAFMGGSSVILAGCCRLFGLELDLIDISKPRMLFTAERIRRTFPDSCAKIRLFHGDLPTYVRDVLLKENDVKVLVQHDGSHLFNQVVRDLSSLWFVREKLHSLAIQDTHLRGIPDNFNFVDAAVYAIFGLDLKFKPIGAKVGDNPVMTTPNQYEGNYFLPNAPEGMYIPFPENTFKYPHPSIPLKAFLPKD